MTDAEEAAIAAAEIAAKWAARSAKLAARSAEKGVLMETAIFMAENACRRGVMIMNKHEEVTDEEG